MMASGSSKAHSESSDEEEEIPHTSSSTDTSSDSDQEEKRLKYQKWILNHLRFNFIFENLYPLDNGPESKYKSNPTVWMKKRVHQMIKDGNGNKPKSTSCACDPDELEEKCTGDDCPVRMSQIECGPECTGICRNKRAQKEEFTVQLQLDTTTEYGECVVTLDNICNGDLVIEYLGEMTIGKVRKMKRYAHPLKKVKNMANMFINCLKMGNESRYIRHSTNDPNCVVQEWIVDGMVRLLVFAVRDIAQYEVITICYPQNRDQPDGEYPKMHKMESERERTERERKEEKSLMEANIAATADQKNDSREVGEEPRRPTMSSGITSPGHSTNQTKKQDSIKWTILVDKMSEVKIDAPVEIEHRPRRRPWIDRPLVPLDPNSVDREKNEPHKKFQCKYNKYRNCEYRFDTIEEYNTHYKRKHGTTLPKFIDPKTRLSEISCTDDKKTKKKNKNKKKTNSPLPEQMLIETLVFYPGVEDNEFIANLTIQDRNKHLKLHHMRLCREGAWITAERIRGAIEKEEEEHQEDHQSQEGQEGQERQGQVRQEEQAVQVGHERQARQDSQAGHVRLGQEKKGGQEQQEEEIQASTSRAIQAHTSQRQTDAPVPVLTTHIRASSPSSEAFKIGRNIRKQLNVREEYEFLDDSD